MSRRGRLPLGRHDIDVTYGRLGAYVTSHVFAIDGPVLETYLTRPRDDPDPGRMAHRDRLADLPRRTGLRGRRVP